MRFLVVLLSIAAICGLIWIVSLPDKAECIASGRAVDPTERHCEAAGGYQQLQEHALFHATQVGLGVVIILVSGYGIRRALRRRSVRSGARGRRAPGA